MEWITNCFTESKETWERRGYIIGDPQPSEIFTVEQMKKEGLVGVYRNWVIQVVYPEPPTAIGSIYGIICERFQIEIPVYVGAIPIYKVRS